jgi:hypothetical protein
MSFEAFNDALILGLNMGCKIQCEVFHMDILKAIGNNIARKIILQEQNLSHLHGKLSIPFLKPFLVQDSHHPCFCIVAIIKTQLITTLPFQSPLLVSSLIYLLWT